MKKHFRHLIAALALVLPVAAFGNAGGPELEKAPINVKDVESLQRGAQIFNNYCLSCHSASGMRFNRLTDLGLTEDQIKKNMMFTTDKIGDTMQAAMNPADAKKWFGAPPPDLTLIARSRGADYLYAYLRGFYQDPTRPSGWNNTVFDKVGMPHPLWEQQGIRAVELDDKGQPVWVKNEHTGLMEPKLYWKSTGLHSRTMPDGKVSEAEFDTYAKDLVTYMVYMGEPAQMKRKQIGYVVLMFLFAVMLPLAYFLKKEYWKDVH